MHRKVNSKLWLCTGGILLAGTGQQARAQLAVTGNLSTTAVTYPSPAPGSSALATQTLNTAFGKNANSNGDTTGSELDAAYGVVENNYLYVFVAGNLQNNNNILQVWIDDGRSGGQNTLNAAASAGSMKNLNGSTFSPGFNATYALELNISAGTPNTNGTLFVDQYNLIQNTATFLGSFGLTGGLGSSAEAGSGETSILVGVNDTNTAGLVSSGNSTTAATAANQTNAQAVSTGIELGIPLATLGSPTGAIEVMAGINGSGDSGLSNQMLPGLPVGSYDVKSVPSATLTNPYYYKGANGVGFNFSSLSNEYFTVPNTVVANGNWLPTGDGNWSSPGNWSNNYVPGVTGDTANFSSATTASQVTLDVSPTIGTLDFNNANSYTIAASSTQTLTFDNGGIDATASINDFGGVHFISAPLVLNSDLTVTCENHGDEMSISGNISGDGGVTVSNSGIYMSTFSALVLSGTNTYLGPTVVERGELQLASANALPTGTALTIDDPNPHGVLDLNGFSATVSSLSATTGGSLPAQITNNNPAAGTSTFTYAGSNSNPSTFPGEITDSSATGGGNTALTVSSGSLTLTGTNTYAGATTVNSGATLNFFSATAAGTTFPVGGNVTNNGSLLLNDNINAGAISGSGATTIAANMNVTATTLNQGSVDNEGNLTLFSGGTVGKITETGSAGAVAVESGTLQLAQNGGASNQSVLYIAPGASLDITNNSFFLDYGSGADPIASIVALIQSAALNGGSTVTWTGAGITSSLLNTTTPGNSAGSYGIGYADSADPGNPANLPSGTIEIMYTLLGDANLDGKVNGGDFTVLAANFNQSGKSWDQGDFNYDGDVNGGDFTLLANNFNQSATQSSAAAADLAALDAFAAANGISLITNSVPEPASLGLMAVAGVGILRRRRRSAGARR